MFWSQEKNDIESNVRLDQRELCILPNWRPMLAGSYKCIYVFCIFAFYRMGYQYWQATTNPKDLRQIWDSGWFFFIFLIKLCLVEYKSIVGINPPSISAQWQCFIGKVRLESASCINHIFNNVLCVFSSWKTFWWKIENVSIVLSSHSGKTCWYVFHTKGWANDIFEEKHVAKKIHLFRKYQK